MDLRNKIRMEKVKEKEKALNFCLESINLKAFFIKVKEMVSEFKLWILDLFTLDSGLMDSSKVKEKKSMKKNIFTKDNGSSEKKMAMERYLLKIA